MNYEEAISYIHNIPRGKKNYDFKNIRRVLSFFDNPQNSLKFIHIAGTNGKGSAASYISAVLSYSSYKTGRFISPFIEKFNERIAIDSLNISDTEIAELVTYMVDVINKNSNSSDLFLSEFEFVTIMALIYFAKNKCDFVVFECGMGGTYDATNVIDCAVVSVIMRIDYDHMQFLGDTIEEIATHKCGIIKPSCPVVSYFNQYDAVKTILNETAKNNGCKLYYADVPEIHSLSFAETVFSTSGYKNISLSLLGTHQPENACVCLKVFDVLKKSGFNICDEAIYKGMKSAKNTGRFEIVSTTPLVIIDGAHNANGIDAFVKSAKDYLADKKITVVVGMLSDKDTDYAVKKICEIADSIIFTTVSSYRSATADTLKETAAYSGIDSIIIESAVDAVNYAVSHAKENDCVCVIGSLYLMGEIRNLFEPTAD